MTGIDLERQQITTYVTRQAYAITAYPLNRFTRIELGGGFNNIDRSRLFVRRNVIDGNKAGEYAIDSTHRDRSLNYIDGQLALVSDNTLFGYTGPVMGRRYRLQVTPVSRSFQWIEYLADYRRYDPIVFNYLTLATRSYADLSVGPNEEEFKKYIARPDFVRGYDRNSSFYLVSGGRREPTSCSAVQLLGSRVAVVNVEARFPLLRKVELGFLPFELPPVDGLFFHDIGLAWTAGQRCSPRGRRTTTSRSSGIRFGLRRRGHSREPVQLRGLRWDYAIPADQNGRKGVWTWSLWPSF